MENQEFSIDDDYYIKLSLGKSLLDSINSLENRLNGVNKLRTKVNQEIAFLTKRKHSNTLKKEHIICSNLVHYEALISKLLQTENPITVLEVQHYNCNNEQKKVVIDIVSEARTRWCKVIARNPKALSQISKGEGEYRQKSILDHAEEFVECAKQNMVLFSPPLVDFYFACGIEHNLAEELINAGVSVSGNIIYTDSNQDEEVFRKNSLIPTLKSNIVNKINLDITAMIAYVSALTNGNANKKLKGKVLNQQAIWERESPVKPVLDKFFEGMELYTCETAMENFQSILNILGGDSEKQRAAEFCSRITVVKDVPFCVTLKPGGQLKPRSLLIFGTGQALKAITVTSNSAFVRAANTQGVHLDVLIHQPRALTERKELV